jgi:glutamyl-Q tRNA(Asp) synthetase
MITRFAPSPTGYLHLGHAFSALTAYRAAEKVGGTFLLRLEDIDHTRCRAAFADAIGEDLAWLGIKVLPPIWVQSERMQIYAVALAQLQQRGLVYPAIARAATSPRIYLPRMGQRTRATPAPADRQTIRTAMRLMRGGLIAPKLCKTIPH